MKQLLQSEEVLLLQEEVGGAYPPPLRFFSAQRGWRGGASRRCQVLEEDRSRPRTLGKSSSPVSGRGPRSSSPAPRSETNGSLKRPVKTWLCMTVLAVSVLPAVDERPQFEETVTGRDELKVSQNQAQT